MHLNKRAIEQLDKEYVTGYGVLDFENLSQEREVKRECSKGRQRYSEQKKIQEVSVIS